MENTISVQGMEITMTTKKWAINSNLNSFLWDKKCFQYFDGEKGYMEQMGQK
jgi:hypothetical protein